MYVGTVVNSVYGGTCVISHMAMDCVVYNVCVRFLTFNLSYSVAMVPVVDLLLCSLASSHHFLVIYNIVNCYGRRQLT